MNRRSLGLALASLAALAWLPAAAAPPARAEDPLAVVATIPDLAWAAERIGGPRVAVESLTRGTENLHAFSVKPRTIVSMSRADLLVEAGLSLEATWLPELVLASRNRAIAAPPGRVTAGAGWEALDVPSSLSRREGDLHPQGNPHFTLSPLAPRHVAERVLAGLVAVDAPHAEEHRARYAALAEELDMAEARWTRWCAHLAAADAKVVVYHMEFDYLLSAAGVETLAAVEPKPGVPPTPRHLAETIARMRAEGATVVLTAAWSAGRSVDQVAAGANGTVLELPTMVGGADWASDPIALVDGCLERLREALGLEPFPPAVEPTPAEGAPASRSQG